MERTETEKQASRQGGREWKFSYGLTLIATALLAWGLITAEIWAGLVKTIFALFVVNNLGELGMGGFKVVSK